MVTKINIEQRRRFMRAANRTWDYIASDADQLEGRLTVGVAAELVGDADRIQSMGGMSAEDLAVWNTLSWPGQDQIIRAALKGRV